MRFHSVGVIGWPSAGVILREWTFHLRIRNHRKTLNSVIPSHRFHSKTPRARARMGTKVPGILLIGVFATRFPAGVPPGKNRPTTKPVRALDHSSPPQCARGGSVRSGIPCFLQRGAPPLIKIAYKPRRASKPLQLDPSTNPAPDRQPQRESRP